MKRKSKVAPGWYVVLLLFFGGLAWGAVLLYNRFVGFPLSAARAEKAAEAYQRAGLPWKAKDIARPIVPAKDNAAPLIAKAMAIWPPHLAGPASEYRDLVNQGKYNQLIKEMESHSQVFDLISRAAQKPGCYIERDLDQGFYLYFPEFSYIKQICQCLACRATAEANLHQPLKALTDLSTARKLGHFLNGEVGLVAVLVQCSIRLAILNSAERCAAAFADDPAALERLDAFLQEPEPPLDMTRARRDEIFLMLATVRSYNLPDALSDPGEPKLPASELKRTGLPSSLINQAFITRFLEIWTEAEPILDNPSTTPVQKEIDLGNFFESKNPGTSAISTMDAVFFPSFTQAPQRFLTVDARRNATRALIAALLIRLKTGKMPTRIEDIPGQWIDPFNGKSLRIAVIGNTTRIYSIGLNMTNDGGRLPSDEKHPLANLKPQSQPDDIVVSYPPIIPKPPAKLGKPRTFGPSEQE